MFTKFCTMATSIGMRVFCMPINQPVNAVVNMTAGAPQIHILKISHRQAVYFG